MERGERGGKGVESVCHELYSKYKHGKPTSYIMVKEFQEGSILPGGD